MTAKTTNPVRKNYLLVNTSVTSFSRGLGIVSGLALDAIVLSSFGLGEKTDALFIASAVPLMICSTFENQVETVVVPVCANQLRESGQGDTHRLLNSFITLSALILAGISLLGMSLSSLIVPIQVPGLRADSIALTVQLSQVLSWLVIVRGVSAILRAILISYHQYMAATTSKFIINVTTILFVLLFKPRFGIYALAFGHLLAGLVAGLFMIVGLRRIGYRYRVVFDIKNSKLKEMFRLLVLPLLSHMLSDVKVLLENFFGSFLGQGSISALRYAGKIIDSIMGVLLGSIVTTTLPLISHYAAAGQHAEMKKAVRDGIKLLEFIALPICVWLAFTSRDLVILLFERGEFTRVNAEQTATIIVLLTPYLVIGRLSGTLQNLFYANLDTKTPSWSGVMTLAVYAATAMVLLGRLGIYAFPVASFVAAVATAVLLSVLINWKYGALGWMELKGFAMRLVGATAVAAAAFTACGQVDWFPGNDLPMKFLRVILPSAIGALAFVLGAVGTRLIQFERVFRYFRTKWSDMRGLER